MIDPIQQRVDERKIFEGIIEMIVDVAAKEFGTDGEARLRIYEGVANSLFGMVASLRPTTSLPNIIAEN